ncbi:MAG: hypothetical protein M3081_05430 [Gemmatimonadota bacterium]|nr:hypothetical protein [Gemmatimonadota bacterium]
MPKCVTVGVENAPTPSVAVRSSRSAASAITTNIKPVSAGTAIGEPQVEYLGPIAERSMAVSYFDVTRKLEKYASRLMRAHRNLAATLAGLEIVHHERWMRAPLTKTRSGA